MEGWLIRLATNMDKKIVAEQRVEVTLDTPELTDNCTHIFYAIEARSAALEPKELGGVLYGSQWKRLSFDHAPIGIPDMTWYQWATSRGYFGYDAATALATWVRAEASAQRKYGIEIRLVEVKAVWSCMFTKVAEFEPLNSSGGPKYEGDIDE